MIKKIDSIKNMAVFQDFCWASSMSDGGNNIPEFKEINILYGRNYSGKTTLSRIFRALETGSISEKYNSSRFQLSFDSGNNVTQSSLKNHGEVVRVFNKDFVEDNFHFIGDGEQSIKSFAILGQDNAKIEEEIIQCELELGNIEEKTGLNGKLLNAQKEFNDAKKKYADRDSKLNDKLRDKANKAGTGIKHNKTFGDANYNITKLKEDITAVQQDAYKQFTDEQVEKYRTLLKEEPKEQIIESASFDLKYSTIVLNAKELIEKKIQASDPIQELLSDAALAKWVRAGQIHHKDKRDKCAFCGNELPADLWKKLDKHFNQESEKLRTDIDRVLEAIENEKTRVPNLLKTKSADFYSTFTQDLKTLAEQLAIHSATCCEALESIKEQLERRKNDIFRPLLFSEPKFIEQNLLTVRDSYEKLRSKSNQFTASLNTNQTQARSALRLNEVFIFIDHIQYFNECKTIEELKEAVEKARKHETAVKTEVDIKRAEINNLKTQLKDESRGAERINDYLNSFFGHPSLSLKAIKEASDDASTGYRFEVIRNNKKAFHLSEGECSLIAFCYFMAKLEDIETRGNQPIIWIDDPISSLDANHIFFIYSLIKAKIVTPEKYDDSGERKERGHFKQLFISTHNLDFLKYLRRLSLRETTYKFQHFIINQVEQTSNIILMPEYLKKYVTEFNFLFHQIYKCAHAQIESGENHDCYYNFGNNARKFLEMFLYYKYPNVDRNDYKLARFFGDDVLAVLLTDRINNEFSHLDGTVERSVQPIDVPEMKKMANFILQKMKENDFDQYLALLDSIGVKRGMHDNHLSNL